MLFDKQSNFLRTDYRSRNFKGDWTKHFIDDYIDSVSSKGIDKTQAIFSEFKSEHLPTDLYKFMPPTIYSLANIIQGTIHLSSPKVFNDPFDSYLFVNEECFKKKFLLSKLKEQQLVTDIEESADLLTTKEYWEIYYSRCEGEKKNFNRKSFWSTIYEISKGKSDNFQRQFNYIITDARNACNSKMKSLRDTVYRISSFSHFSDEEELLENTTMWSHYADNHRGFCVKYKLDFEHSDFREILLCGLFPVRYRAKTEEITANQLFNLKEKNNELIIDDNVKKKILKSHITKSRFWSYEKEWRLILSQRNCCLLYENNIIFPKIEAIYLGSRVDKSIEKLLVQFGEMYNIQIFKTKKSDYKFTLSAYPIDNSSQKSDEFFYKIKKLDSIKDKEDRQNLLSVLHKEWFEIEKS